MATFKETVVKHLEGVNDGSLEARLILNFLTKEIEREGVDFDKLRARLFRIERVTEHARELLSRERVKAQEAGFR